MTLQASYYSLPPARLLSLIQTIMIVIVLVLISIPSALPSSENQALKGLHGAPNIHQLTNDLPCGATWEKIGGKKINAIAVTYGNGLYVAVEEYKSILTSPDGITWTRHDVEVYGLKSIAWSGNQFVVVGADHTILTSPDGMTWTPHWVESAFSSLQSVAWGGNQFVAVGSNQILTSSDGITWTAQVLVTNKPPPMLWDVTWGNGQFVAVGSGAIWTSPDGITWSIQESNWLRAVAWGDGQFVAVGEKEGGVNVILTSPDGVTWTHREIEKIYTSFEDVAWGGGQFVVLGVGVVLISPDGVTWTPHNLVSGDSYGYYETYDRGITWSGDQFLVVTAFGAILISSDGIAWTRVDDAASRPLSGITWNGNQFVAVGSDTILTSPDGMTWTSRDLRVGRLYGVAWGNGQFVVVGGGVILTSPDGVAWTTRDPGVRRPLDGVAWGNGQFVVVGLYVILTSPDGMTWTIRESRENSPESFWLKSVAWGDGQFVAVGDQGLILTSSDGITWTQHETGTSRNIDFVDVVWGNGQFVVATGYDYQSSSYWVLTSSDGVAWVRRDLGIKNVGFSVTWGNNQFLMSVGGGVLISPDAATWTLYDVGDYYYYDVTWGDNQFVAVGSLGISRSLCAASVAPSKIGVFRNGTWFLDRNGNGEWEGCSQDGGQDLCVSFQPFNRSSGWPVVGDWESGIQSAVGLFRARAGRWFLDRNNNQAWDGCGIDRCYAGFGRAGHRPVTGDWNGAGITRIGVFRDGEWYLDANGNGQWDGCSPDDADQCPTLGQSGDLPVAGDWTGTGIARIGVFRDGNWRLDANGNGQWDGCPPDGPDECPVFGQRGDLPITGDWNGAGVTRIGVFRNGEWYLDANGNGQWDGCSQDGGQDACFNFGRAGDWPVAGKW